MLNFFFSYLYSSSCYSPPTQRLVNNIDTTKDLLIKHIYTTHAKASNKVITQQKYVLSNHKNEKKF